MNRKTFNAIFFLISGHLFELPITDHNSKPFSISLEGPSYRKTTACAMNSSIFCGFPTGMIVCECLWPENDGHMCTHRYTCPFAYANLSHYTQGHKGGFEKTRTQSGGPGVGSNAGRKK